MSNENLLSEKFASKPWFDSVGRDQYGRLTIYVRFMNLETMTEVPSKIDGDQVMVHFVANKTAKSEDFTLSGSLRPSFLPLVEEELDNEGELPFYLLESDIGDLIQELERLEKICGTNTLSEIFFEEHDQENAITNLSAKFPEVRESISKLYQIYGFDVIYEELEL